MVVRLDLRLPGKETREERESGYQHLFLFASVFLFAITATLVFVIGAWQLYSLRDEKIRIEERTSSDTVRISVMDRELSRITEETSRLEFKMDYMLSDIPSIEILTSIVKILPGDINIETFSLASSRLAISGTGRNEEEILDFADKLNNSHFADKVSLPAIAQGTRNGAPVRTFKLECSLLPLTKIISGSAAEYREAPVLSKEGETL